MTTSGNNTTNQLSSMLHR